jgi:hypothetical protein
LSPAGACSRQPRSTPEGHQINTGVNNKSGHRNVVEPTKSRRACCGAWCTERHVHEAVRGVGFAVVRFVEPQRWDVGIGAIRHERIGTGAGDGRGMRSGAGDGAMPIHGALRDEQFAMNLLAAQAMCPQSPWLACAHNPHNRRFFSFCALCSPTRACSVRWKAVTEIECVRVEPARLATTAAGTPPGRAAHVTTRCTGRRSTCTAALSTGQRKYGSPQAGPDMYEILPV